MGLILIPSEIRAQISNLRSFISENKNFYTNALSVVQSFAEKENLDAETWNKLKSTLSEYYEAIVVGYVVAQDSIECDLLTLESSIGNENLYEDELRQQIEMLENECVRHEQTITSLLNMISSGIPTESQFAFDSVMNSVQAMLAHTKMELQELKRKLSFLLEVESTTSGLFNAAIQLLAVVTNVIADAEICINGSETPLDSKLSIVIEKAENELIVDNLDEMLQSELGIDMDTYKEVYGEEKVKELEQYVIDNKIYGYRKSDARSVVIKALEVASGCNITRVYDEQLKEYRYRVQVGNATVSREYSGSKIVEKLKLGAEGWESIEIVIPESVTGTVNGESKIFEPHVDWGGPGKGNYPLGVQKDEEGRYKIAVGPKIIKPDYKDSQRIWGTDFEDCAHEIVVVLENVETKKEKIIECIVVDYKAHSYNKYPDGQPHNTGDVASFDVENGIIQTGIAYPNSANAKKSEACATYTMNGSVIEFAGHEVDFNTGDYVLKEIIVVED